MRDLSLIIITRKTQHGPSRMSLPLLNLMPDYRPTVPASRHTKTNQRKIQHWPNKMSLPLLNLMPDYRPTAPASRHTKTHATASSQNNAPYLHT